MKIKTAEFVISNTDIKKCPDDNLPEYAFIGRSNVGKSSLINMLTERKSLAKISSTPGKTQLINHFIINDNWYLVDLPGYGYAKVSKTNRKKFEKFIWDYIEKRKQLINLFVLIDSRHEPLNIDIEFMNKLGQKGIPFSIVFTKTDKLSSSKLSKNLNAYKKKLLVSWEILPKIFSTSSISKIGRLEIINYIDEISKNIKAKN
jgi:GTP-binding protein